MEENSPRNATIVDIKPQAPKFSALYMDKSAKPCNDLYTYSNGKWLKETPIPEDKSSYGTMTEMYEWNTYLLGKILEESAFGKIQGDLASMLGNFHKSVINLDKLETVGFKPIKDIMDGITRISDRNELLNEIINLHSLGIQVFYSTDPSPDKKDSSKYTLYLVQGGLNLPDREYYLSSTFAQIKKDYADHIENMCNLYGFSNDQSKKISGNVLEIEEGIAKISRSRADLRDDEKNYNKIDYEDALNKFKHLKLEAYFSKLGIPKITYLIVGQPEVLEYINKIMDVIDLDKIKSYLYWNVITFAAPYLHSAADTEHFNFYGKKLMGQPIQGKRWKKSVSLVDAYVGEALGSIFVSRYFTEESKKKSMVMVNDILQTFHERLEKLPWLEEETRKRALLKLSKLRVKLGFPDNFRDYSSLLIQEDDLFGNILRSTQFEMNRVYARVGTDVDPNEWYMTPPTINAYFSPTDNEIVFPAGILQPPCFDPDMDDAVNYGSIGAVIGHEITHGYDDQGRNYDENGNINNWWTETDKEKFEKLSTEIEKMYSAFEPLPGLNVNGKLTLGENIADIGGVSIAYEALQKKFHRDGRPGPIDGMTPEQRFFVSFSQLWKYHERDEYLKLSITMDPHSPVVYRGTIPAYMHEKFLDSFNCDKNSNSTKRVNIW